MLPPLADRRAVLLLSGGVDSTTALALMARRRLEVDAVIFDYGQTLRREIDVAVANADRYNARPIVVDLDLLWTSPGCALLGNPDAIPLDRSQPQINGGQPPTNVPFRNGVFLSMAAAYCIDQGINQVWGGFNGLHSGQYPDDARGFLASMQIAINRVIADDKAPLQIVAPWCDVAKSTIVQRGLELGVDYGSTWSCYQNGDRHCGRCDSCYQRNLAFAPHRLQLDGSPIG